MNISVRALLDCIGGITIVILLASLIFVVNYAGNLHRKIETMQSDRVAGLEEGAIVACLLAERPAIIASNYRDYNKVEFINSAAEEVMNQQQVAGLSTYHKQDENVDSMLRGLSSHHLRCYEISPTYSLYTFSSKPFYGSTPTGSWPGSGQHGSGLSGSGLSGSGQHGNIGSAAPVSK